MFSVKYHSVNHVVLYSTDLVSGCEHESRTDAAESAEKIGTAHLRVLLHTRSPGTSRVTWHSADSDNKNSSLQEISYTATEDQEKASRHNWPISHFFRK